MFSIMFPDAGRCGAAGPRAVPRGVPPFRIGAAVPKESKVRRVAEAGR